MSKTYEKVGAGRFFEQENVTGNQPLFKGSAEIHGTEFDVALWPRESKNGHRYLSIQFTLKGDREKQGDGALFVRDRKSNRAPSLSGPCEISGRKFEASVWPQTSEAGKEYYRMKVEAVTEGA